jgi:DNA-binding MarR family transcriptional regulator
MTKNGPQQRIQPALAGQGAFRRMDDKAKPSGRPVRAAKSAATAPRVDLGNLGSYIGFHLRVAQDASFRAFARVSGQHNIKPGRFAALTVIARNPGISQAALGQSIARDKSSITPLIQDLQRLGLIERRSAVDDRRRVELCLTGAGQKHLERLQRVAGAHDAKLDEIVGAKKDEFIELLRKIANEID